MVFSLEAYLEDRRGKVERFLEEHCAKTSSSSSEDPRLREAIRYSLLAGGKRIRPILVIAAFEAIRSPLDSMGGVGGRAGSPPDFSKASGFASALPIACAIEMIHTYSLIHDDLPAMDNDDLRRGRPTNHKAFGEATAILAGDALLTDAFALIASESRAPAPVVLEVIRTIAEAAGGRGMAWGQALDLSYQGKKISQQELEALHRHKTGCLLEVSVTSGARLAGAKGETLARMRDYGRAIGLAFQIADDILDVEGNSEAMGKNVGGDSRKEKATYPSVLGLDASKKKAIEWSEKAIAALASFDDRADPLRGIARYIVRRGN